jgi:glycosyltransferase involved in cell wall biosynthesis
LPASVEVAIKQRRTIIYVGGFELPDKNAAAHRVLAVGKLLRDLGYNVVYLGLSRTLAIGTALEETRSEVDGFVTWAQRYPESTKEWLQYIAFAGGVRALIEAHYKEDVLAVICYNHPAVAQAAIQGLCRRLGIAHIADATEWYDSTSGPLPFRIVKWLDTTLRMRVIHVRADGVIATSRYLAEFYRLRRCTVVEIPTLCDAEALASAPSMPRPRAAGTLYLMYAGSPFHSTRVDRERNNLKDRLDAVISLLGRMQEHNCRFVLEICGITKENYLLVFPEHTELLRRMSDSVIFLGRRDFKETIARIKSCDFTIFLRRESRTTLAGFPTKFSESISCGTPVVTNLLSNIEGYLHDGVNGFALDFDNSDAQDRGMLRIFAVDRAGLERMRLNCLQSRELDFRSFSEPVRRFITSITGRP